MAHSHSKPVLLIADADSENINVLKTLLTPDYVIEVAADKDEVIRIASSTDGPDLILLNDLEPAVDMLEVCSALKADKLTCDIPIIFISKPGGEDRVAEGFELGAADYLPAPLMRSVVRARVLTHLELKRYRDSYENRVKTRVNELQDEIQERREVEDTYRALVENARDGIAIIHDFIVKYANPAFCTMLGLSDEELIGAHLKKFISDEEFIKNTTRYSDRIKGLNLPRIYKSQVIHSDGSTIDVELNVSVIPYERSLAAFVLVRDMREEEAWQYSI